MTGPIAVVEAAFTPFELSPPQALVVRVILPKPGLPQRVLAAELSIARPTATCAVDFLETQGLVERRGRDVMDARVGARKTRVGRQQMQDFRSYI